MYTKQIVTNRFIGWFVVACIVSFMLHGRVAWAAPVPTATVTSPLSEFAGELFTTQACLDNTGDATGFEPVFELITPAGVTFNSAAYLGNAVSVSPAQTCSTLTGCTFTDPDTNLPVSVAYGSTFQVLRFPLGSFTTDQPAQCMDLNFTLGNSPTVQLGTAKNLTLTPIFSLGKDPLDDPAIDPPLAGTSQTIVVNPTVIKHSKTVSGEDIDNETATGPNYVRTVTLTVDVAKGETVNPVTVSDTLPSQFQFVAITNNAGCTPTSTPSTTTPGGTLTLNCGSITGVAGVEKTITFTVYIPRLSAANTPILNATTPNRVEITNTSSVNTTYLGTPLPSVTASDSIFADAVALKKVGAVVNDTGPSGLSPGDTVEYTLTGTVSDYFTVGNISVTDTLGDGQTYDSSFTPTLILTSNGATETPITLTPTMSGKDANGLTLITFDLSAAIDGSGQLVGDLSGGDTTQQGATSFVIKLRSTVDDAYTGSVAPDSTQTLSDGDAIDNESQVTFQIPGSSDTVSNTSSSHLTIATPEFTKKVYAHNSDINPSNFLVAAGDTVTYRLTTTLSISSIEGLRLTDYLPSPLYDVPTTLTNAGPCVDGSKPPAANAWCYTNIDTISSTAPTVSTNSVFNRIVWDYGTRETSGTSSGTIDILYTLQATAEPMADQLDLANLAIISYHDSQSATDQTAGAITKVTTKQPQLAIKKEITAVSHGTVIATPTTGYDAEAQGLDAGDTVSYRVRITNSGSALAYAIRVTDNAGTLTPTPFSVCTTPTATLGDGSTSLGTSGDLFTATGLTITPSLAGNGDGTIQPNEVIWISYTCTLAADATPRSTDIDNTAVLKYYSNIDPDNPPAGLTVSNFATDTALLTRKARLTTLGIQSITKVITASSVPGSTPNSNINYGETLTFKIEVTLSEGTYTGFELTDRSPIDSSPTILSPITCGSNGFSCDSNVSVSGSTVTVAATTGSTVGTIAYTYSQAKTASDTNIATVSATDAPEQEAKTSWTLDNPDPAITKTLSPSGNVNAGDTVQVRLGWSNTDNDNPMFRCVITDVLDPNVFDLTTPAAVTTPTGYTFAYDSGTGTITYTYTPTPTPTNPESPCPTVAAGGAVFSVKIKNNAVTGSSYENKAQITAKTLPSNDSNASNANTVTASVIASFAVTATSNTKTITATSQTFTTGTNVAIGETVSYDLTFTLPKGITKNVILADAITTGSINDFTLVSATLARSNTSLTAAENPGSINDVIVTNTPVPVTLSKEATPCPDPVGTGNQFCLALGDVDNSTSTNSSDTYTLAITLRIANIADNSIAHPIRDRGRIYYDNASGAQQTVSTDEQTITVVLPQVSIGKTVSPASPSAGDIVTYQLTVTNTTDAHATTGFDWTFTDTLPADLSEPLITGTNVGTTGAVVSISPTGNTLNGTIDQLDPGESITITYTAQVNPATPFGKTITNSAKTTATTIKNTSPDDPDEAGERTGAGDVNNLYASTTKTVTTSTPTLSKALVNAQTRYAIGDIVHYRLTFGVPVGTTTNLSIVDTLPTGLSFLPTGTYIPVITIPPDSSITTSSSNVSQSGTKVTFTLGTITATKSGNITIDYYAQVANVIGNQNGTSRANSAIATYDNPAGGTPLNTTAASSTLTVGEPNLTMTKTILSGATGSQAGSSIQYRFTVRNGGNTTAYQATVSDLLPVGLYNISGVSVAASGGNIQQNIAGCTGGTAVSNANAVISTTSNTNDTLTLSNLCIAPGATLTVSYNAVLMNTVLAGQTLTNPVRTHYASQPTGTSSTSTAVVRDNASGPGSVDDDVNNNTVLNNYEESASISLTVAAPIAIDKQADKTQATIGETVAYTLKINVIQGVTPYVTVTDVLPVGLSYVSHTISVGHTGMTLGNANYNTRLGTSQTVQFNLGNVSNPANLISTDDYLTVEIVARVDNIAANQAGVVLSNGVNGAVNVQYGTTPTTVIYDYDTTTAGIQGRPLTITEPALTMSKTATPSAQSLGDIVTFTISLQNTGTATAFDLNITDILPTGLTYIAGSASLPSPDVTISGQNLSFNISTLGNGNSTSFTYQARVDTSATVGVALTNNAQLTWKSLSGATGAADNGRTGADGPNGTLNDYATRASTPVTPIVSAAIYAPKTVAIAVDNTAPSGIANPGDVLEYTITLINTGSNAVNNVVFTDPIPANTTYVSGSVTSTSGTPTNPASQVNVAVGSMAPNAQVTIKFRVTINVGIAEGVVIRNQGAVDSDETVPKPTDGDGNPNNGDQPTDIPVGGQPALTSALYAEKTVAWISDVDGSSTINAGDILRYTIILRNRGATTLTGLSFSDTIPTGLTYVAASASADSGTATVTGQAINWTGIADIAPGAWQTLNFDVTIGTISGTNQTFINQGTATSTQTGVTLTDSNGDPSDGAQPTSVPAVGGGGIASPVLNVEKRWSLAVDNGNVGVVDPGDTVQYIIAIRNTGSAAATNVRFSDAPLPTQFTYVPDSLATSLGAIETQTPIAVNIGTLNPGQTVIVLFQMTVNAGTNGQIASNQATTTASGGISVKSDDNNDDSDGLNPTLTPIGPVAPSGLSKSLFNTSVNSDTSNQLQVGEIVTYQIQAHAPAGTTGEVTMIDTLPAGMSYVAGTARLARVFTVGLTASQNPGGVNSVASGTFVALSDGSGITASGSTLSVFLGDVINSDSSATTTGYILELQARVTNVASNQAGTDLNNQTTISYRNTAGQLSTLTSVTTPQSQTVVEPNLQISKAANINTVLAGTASTVRFTVTLTNPSGANVSTAYDLSLSDALPVGFASANEVSTTPSGGVSGAACSFSGTTTLNCSASVFPPDGQLVILYDATTTASLTDGSSLTNNAIAQWTSLPGSNTNERTGTGGINDYTNASGVTLHVGTPALAKSILDLQTRYAIGDVVSYQVVLSFSGTLSNVSFQDVLPEGLTYIPGTLTLSYDSGLSSSNNPSVFTDTDNSPGAGQETLSLNFGTMINNSGTPKTLTLRYQALVDNILVNQEGESLTNTASLIFDKPGVDGEQGTASDSETATVGEPHLQITHEITSSMTGLEAGDTVSYQITVENTGTTPAFETTLRDLLPPELYNVQGISVVLTNTSGSSETPTITTLSDGWESTPFDLQPGDVLTIQFTATLQDTVQPGQTVQATVDASYSSRDGSDPNQRDGSTPNSNQDDTLLNNYNIEALSPTLIMGDPVALNKAFYPDAAKITYAIGETVGYRLTLAISQGEINDVNVIDTLPAGLIFLSATVGYGHTGIISANGGAQTQTGQELSFDFGDIQNPANDSTIDDFITIDIQARVANIAANQNGVVLGNAAQVDFTDGASISQTRYFDADADTLGNQPLDLTVVEPDLTLDKAASSSQPSLGDEVTFTLTIDHTAISSADAFDLLVIDTLPVGLTYVTGSATPPVSTISSDGQSLSWDIASLSQATDNLTISYRALVSSGAVVGASLNNTAILYYASQPGANGGPDSGRTGIVEDTLDNYTATDGIAVTPTASMLIAAQKTVALFTDLNHNGIVNVNDILQYTITLTNTSDDPANNVVFTDAIPINTQYVANSSTLNGTAAGSFSDDTLSITVGTLAPQASVTIVFQVKVNQGTPNGFIISNQGVVDSDQTVPTPTDVDGDPSNGAQPTTIPVGGLSNTGALRAEKRVALQNDIAPIGTVSSGDTLRYTITLHNSGTTDLTGLTLSDPIPAGLSYVSANPSATLTGSTLSWTGLNIAVGGSLTLTFDVTIDAFTGLEKTFSNQGTVSGTQVGNVLTDGNSDPSDGAQPTVITAANTAGTPRLDLQKRWRLVGNVSGGTAVNPGDIVLYTLTVSNTGSTAATNVRIVEDTLPPQVTFISGSVLTSSGILESEHPLTINVGTLDPGAKATISFRVEVKANTTGQTASNQATATGDNTSETPSDNDSNPDDGRDPTEFPIRASSLSTIPTLSEWGLIFLSLLMVLLLKTTRWHKNR